MQRVGSRRQVWNKTAKQTSGGLTRSELFQDKYGNIKSRRASKKAKRNQNLKKAGWTFKKGSFGAVRVEEKKKKGKKTVCVTEYSSSGFPWHCPICLK